MNGDLLLYETLRNLKIAFDFSEHPPAPTIEDAMPYRKDIDRFADNLSFLSFVGIFPLSVGILFPTL